MRQLTRILVAVPVLLLSSAAYAQTANTASYTIDGHVSTEVVDAPASLAYNQAGKVWILTAVKDRYRVSLFFSQDFTPATSTFPVRYQYRGEKDTLGGSVIVPTGEGRKTRMYSHDTEGEVTFETFDARAVGTFKTYDGYKDPRNDVTAQGSFDVAMPADAFE